MTSSGSIKNYYSIMGVSRNATSDELKRAFKDKAKKYHPDVSKAPDAHQKFIEIGEAYEVLKDPNSRREYDALLDQTSRRKQYTQTDSSSRKSYQSRDYSDFRDTQQKAKTQAENYASMDIDDLITNVLGFIYKVGKVTLVGQSDRPRITLGHYIKLGLSGIVLTISIALLFTGIGTIPGIIIAKGVTDGLHKDGKFIGFGPLILSTIVAYTVIIMLIIALFNSIFS